MNTVFFNFVLLLKESFLLFHIIFSRGGLANVLMFRTKAFICLSSFVSILILSHDELCYIFEFCWW